MRRSTVAFLLSLLATAGTARAAGTLFWDNVESGIDGWTADGLWHRATASDPCLEAHGGAASWYYGTGACSFDTGARNSGSLTSSPISIPAGTPIAQLSFWYWYATETTGPAWDRRYVQVSVDGGDFEDLAQLSGDSQEQWHEAAFDLTAYAGHTVRLRFFFDTIDHVANGLRGWYVDDILVYMDDVAYTFAPTTFDWIDISGTPALPISNVDDDWTPVSLGFSFPYYGSVFGGVNVSSNGFLSFDAAGAATYGNVSIPSEDFPNNLIAAFWDDLYTGESASSNIYAATVGVAPDRKFVVQYEDVDFCCSPASGRLNFEIILSEADGSITMQYQDMLSANPARGAGDSATIGVENSAGTAGTQYSYLAPVVQNGMALIAQSTTDADGDGLSDAFELRYGTNPADGADPVVTVDVDGDGLTWIEEYAFHTNPLSADTDDDTVPDGTEVRSVPWTNPAVRDPATVVTFAGPGTSFGTAYLEFDTPNFDPETTSFRLYYGPLHASTLDDYPITIDIPDVSTRAYMIDQSWGMQGQPMVFFRVAPLWEVAGRTYVGSPSNEGATYFAGSEPTKDGSPAPGQGDDPDGETDDFTDVADSNGSPSCFVQALGGGPAAGGGVAFGLLLAAGWLLRRKAP